jgi:hypothetical protein
LDLAEQNAYPQLIAKFTESSFADVDKQPLHERFGGTFMEFSG